ncbi:MAG: adenylate kinase [Elusimicrobia bacterium]|nr:adenylate kinase [Elusimicrobiota bacterium]
MNLILLGCPGSGKGTQAKNLKENYPLLHLATGDIFREAIRKKTDLGQKVAEYVHAGKLVPDALVLEVVRTRLQTHSGGFLLDGFPRTLEQAQGLDTFLSSRGKHLDWVFYLDLSQAQIIQRLSNRRYCSGCQAVYNLLTRPSASVGSCDLCGGKLTLREDDQPETIRKRLMVYQDLTEPLISYYKANESFLRIDAMETVENIFERIRAILGNRIVQDADQAG